MNDIDASEINDHLSNIEDALTAAKELVIENENLRGALAKCRAAAGWGTDLDPMDSSGFAALGDPLSVPFFVESQFRMLKSALEKIASCEKIVDGDVVDIARKALIRSI